MLTDITLELRSLGVPWSLHAWTLSLAAAADAALDHVIDQLLQDFLQVRNISKGFGFYRNT